MRNTNKKGSFTPITVDIVDLAQMLDCGEDTARKIGTDAGATIQIGRRVLYKISIIDQYLNAMASDQNLSSTRENHHKTE